jgi:hypothetical protein
VNIFVYKKTSSPQISLTSSRENAQMHMPRVSRKLTPSTYYHWLTVILALIERNCNSVLEQPELKPSCITLKIRHGRNWMRVTIRDKTPLSRLMAVVCEKWDLHPNTTAFVTDQRQQIRPNETALSVRYLPSHSNTSRTNSGHAAPPP